MKTERAELLFKRLKEKAARKVNAETSLYDEIYYQGTAILDNLLCDHSLNELTTEELEILFDLTSDPEVQKRYKEARAESEKLIEDLKKSEKVNDDVLKIMIDV
jgi:hypothetical protein